MTLFRRLALATTLTTLGVIGVGGLVRATNSGLGCPSWPKCFGRWIPPLEYHAIIEWTHRFIGAVAITLLVVTAIVAVVNHRRDRRIVLPTIAASLLIFVQAGLGAIVVNSKNSPTLVTIHMATAMLLVGLLVFVTVTAFVMSRAGGGGHIAAIDRTTSRLALAAAGSVYVLILIGAYVRGQGAALAFPDWPLMNGTLLPHLGGLATTNFLHRAVALVVGIIVFAFAIRATRARPRNRAIMTVSHAAVSLYLMQAVVGGLQILTRLKAEPVVMHVLLSGLLWSSLVAAVTLTRYPAIGEKAAGKAGNRTPARAPFSDTLKAYIALTKPRIVLLLLITTVPTMLLAERGMPSVWLMFATVFGGALAAGAANAINMFFDRDIDGLMDRTSLRPLPRHAVTPARAIVFAICLSAVSFWFMTLTVNLLAATLTQSAVLFYVLVYTLGLKRTTPQNIVIGGAAGAVPVLVGWAAVTGYVGIEAYVLFCIIFFWTPPHFWALAMRFSKDYAAAGVPMLPVVAGERETQRQIVFYSFITVAVTLALYPVARMGAIYLAAAAVLGTIFIRHAIVLRRTGTPHAAMGLFKYSITYLALLFTAVGVDAVMRVHA